MKRQTRLIRYDRDFLDSISVLRQELSSDKPLPIVINGLSDGATRAYLSEAILELVGNGAEPPFIIVPSDAEREKLVAYLNSLGISALQYKPREFVFHNISASHDTERERLSVLSKIIFGSPDVIIATASSALSYTIPRELLHSLALTVRVGDEISISALVERLSSLGFARVDSVESAGQYSTRGGIVDVWHSIDAQPVRVEFFGDEVDRIVCFDPISQRSNGQLSSLEVLPATEVLVSDKARGKILKTVNSLIEKCESEEIKKRLISEKTALENNLSLDFRDKYMGLVYDKCENLLSYLGTKRRAVFVLDTNGVKEEAKRAVSLLSDTQKSMIDMGTITEPCAKYTADERAFSDFLSENVTVHLNVFSTGLGTLKTSGLFGFRCRRTVSYGDNPSMLVEDLNNYRHSSYRVLILAENKQGADALVSSLASEDIAVAPIYNKDDFDFDTLKPSQVAVDVGACEGYELITPKIAVLSMAKDEGRLVMANRRRQRILKRVGGAGERLMSYADLTPGDYVVHSSYGIGMFEGMQTVNIDGVTKDYITIRYAGTDKLFVPCDRLEFIGKYIGQKDKDGKVKLSKMGGSDWVRAKTRAKNATRDIAKELIKLYAERQRLQGFAFPPDSELEEEFASSFDYVETPSQITAIEEIKRDMMRPVPMNRLLCGDVGFGKTEVALRSAFKAIMGGKQVAILVPTTILALQHYETTLARMRNYPVTVEMLSRFRTPKEQEKILRRTKRGEIDILIGTHKLLSKNVEFRDLGLLIIDEEQRFGVAQKEKLKAMQKNVDVLTLSATPIPRTLNMAMNGISDMSILDEAPGDRRPVQTYVLEHDEAVILDAIKKELMRGGQVLYLYNKVEDIDLVAGRIIRALPEARVTFAHGQMDKDELEDIWQLLVRGEIDVLVCTTIIETGVDLPNANTLIIENADRMGLSQLHQIRGRVGRSSRQAYAYFTYRVGKALSEVATKRLSAIREYAEFGAGFKVALRDLEIRGAGNLLGAEQHGYIDSVGYDLYVKLLNEAVQLESGKEIEAPFESVVDVKVDANIPSRYISVSSHRMEMYKKISLIREPSDLEDVLDEFIDRFGEPPRELMRLLRISLIRALSSEAQIRKVEYRDGLLSFCFEKPRLDLWSEVFDKFPSLSLRATTSPTVFARVKSVDEALVLSLDALTVYCEAKKKADEIKD